MSGPDIFLSYNREDANRARQFAKGFAAEGLDVWWDVALRSGEAYDEVTEAALRNAKAVVVLWSQKSVVSRWVRAEATLAERKKTLMPAMIEPCERPIMFELVQTADLSHWQGDTADRVWQAFASHVCDFVGKDATTARGATQAPEPLPALDHLSIVVLPFTNMSGDPEQEYFADGITEDIITDLSQVSALRVIARSTAFTFKGRHVDIAEVARRLNVTHVLEGSVRKAGERVRVTAQLIDGSNSEHVWASRYDRDLHDIFALQDELSKAIVEALRLKLLPEEREAIEERGTDNFEAYDLFLRARVLYGELQGDSLMRAIELLRAAITLDPQFLQAYRQLAATLDNSRVLLPEFNDRFVAEVREIEETCRRIAPDKPFVTLMQAQRLAEGGDIAGAMELIRKVPADYRSFIFWMNRQSFEIYVGRFEGGLELARDLVRHDPLNRMLSFTLQNLLAVVGREAEADAETQRCRDLPGNSSALELLTFTRMKGKASADELAEQYRRFLSCHGFELTMPICGQLAPHLQDHETARELIRTALGQAAYQDFTRTVWLALLAAYFDEGDVAIAALERAYIDMKAGVNLRIYMWLPVLREVRQDPRFKAILRRLDVYDYWRSSGNWGDFARPVGDDDFEIIG